MSNAAIAFLAGMGGGYLSQKDKNREQERQDAKDAMQKQEFDARMAELDQAKKDRQALRDAGTAATVNTNAATLDTGDGPKVYDMPAGVDSTGVAQSDARQFSRLQANTAAQQPAAQPQPSMAAQVGAGQPAPVDQTAQPIVADPAQPTAPAAPAITPTVAPAFAVRGTAYPNQAAAQGAADQYNATDAYNQRVIAATRGIDPVKAIQLDQQTTEFKAKQLAAARQLKKEGVLDTAEAFQRGDVDAMKKAFNSGGDAKIVGDIQIKPESRDIPGVGTIPGYSATFTVQNKDGTTQTITRNSVDTNMALMPFKQLLDVNLANKKQASEGDLNAAKVNYYNSFANQKDALADNVGNGKPGSIDRMSEIDKATLLNINKQRDAITTAIIKGRADGSFQEDSPGAKALNTQLATLNLKQQQLQEKYGDGGSAPDPMGLRGSKGGSKSPSKGEAGMRASASGDMGQKPGALDAEIRQTQADMMKVTDAPSKQALQEHLVYLQGQKQRYGANPAPSLAAQTSAPAAAPAAAPATTNMAAQTTPASIPAPPPRTLGLGGGGRPNPGYAAWEKQYGAAYLTQQQQADAADAARHAELMARARSQATMTAR